MVRRESLLGPFVVYKAEMTHLAIRSVLPGEPARDFKEKSGVLRPSEALSKNALNNY
jgi:hypothetical protein